jgi:RNA polymerase sigma-70 factor, ECF subfamily
MASSGEQALIRKVKKGDLDAYGAIVQDYQSSVFNVCCRILGNRQEAEDLTQEAFLRAFHQIASFDLSRPFGPWMRTVAANLCYNHLKRSRLNRVPLEDERDTIKDNTIYGPEGALEINQEHQALYRAIWELPDMQRIALELRHFQGLSYKEMAHALNLPLNTVRSHLYRGRQKLAELLEEKNE